MTGKNIFNEDTFNSDTAKAGDLVEERIVDDFMNCRRLHPFPRPSPNWESRIAISRMRRPVNGS